MKGSGVGARDHLGVRTLPEHHQPPPPGSPLPWELASHRCRRTLEIQGLQVQPPWEPQISRWLWAGEGTLCRQVGAGEMLEHPWGTLTSGAHLHHPTVATALEGTQWLGGDRCHRWVLCGQHQPPRGWGGMFVTALGEHAGGAAWAESGWGMKLPKFPRARRAETLEQRLGKKKKPTLWPMPGEFKESPPTWKGKKKPNPPRSFSACLLRVS